MGGGPCLGFVMGVLHLSCLSTIVIWPLTIAIAHCLLPIVIDGYGGWVARGWGMTLHETMQLSCMLSQAVVIAIAYRHCLLSLPTDNVLM